MSSIAEFKGQMIYGGARANQFKCTITFPGIVANGSLAAQKTEFLAKASSLPSSSVSDVAVSYRGRPVHFAGEREFEPWTIDVYNDNDFVVRNAFEDWVNKVQNADSTSGVILPSQYQTDMQVHQLDRNDTILKSYSFKDAYPVSVSAIQLDWDANNQIEIYQVQFQYNYWTAA